MLIICYDYWFLMYLAIASILTIYSSHRRYNWSSFISYFTSVLSCVCGFIWCLVVTVNSGPFLRKNSLPIICQWSIASSSAWNSVTWSFHQWYISVMLRLSDDRWTCDNNIYIVRILCFSAIKNMVDLNQHNWSVN